MSPSPSNIFGAFCLVVGFAACLAADKDSQEETVSLDQDFAAVRASYTPKALSYLEAALDTLKRHHIAGPEHDWEELHLVALEQTEGAQAPAETYEAIRFALQDLNERHGYLRPPPPKPDSTSSDSTSSAASSNRQSSQAAPPVEQPQPALQVRDGIAKLTVPPLWDPKGQRGSAYARSAQRLIEEADAAGACGWLVDLRGNGGGNMWPMIAGLGPLLGEGNVGAFVGRSGTTGLWKYEAGKAKLDETVHVEVADPYEVHSTKPAVAVLTGAGTGSSGEAVAIAFQGRGNTRSFGQPTGGASTVPGYFELSDGAWLVFSTERMADRVGNAYGGAVAPDQVTEQPVEAAISWLRDQEACSEM